MTDPNYTAIQIVVDRSGSMMMIRDDAQGALAAFLKDQTTLPGKATIRLSQFDDQYEVVYPSTPVDDIPAYELHPRGSTALNDAVGRAITEFGSELAGLPEDTRPGVVIFVIITDGMENSSKEFSIDRVKDLVELQQGQWNWNFVFLAANQDAVLTGGTFGIQAGSSMTFNTSSAGIQATGRSLGAYAAATRAGQTYTFSDAERSEAADEGDQS